MGKMKITSFLISVYVVTTSAFVSMQNLKVGKIGSNSYVPSGLSADQYNKIRGDEKNKRDQNYARNVAKAFKYQDYTEFYKKRGTDTKQDWIKSVTRGHAMAKTKYDWSGKAGDEPGYQGPALGVGRKKQQI